MFVGETTSFFCPFDFDSWRNVECEGWEAWRNVIKSMLNLGLDIMNSWDLNQGKEGLRIGVISDFVIIFKKNLIIYKILLQNIENIFTVLFRFTFVKTFVFFKS